MLVITGHFCDMSCVIVALDTPYVMCYTRLMKNIAKLLLIALAGLGVLFIGASIFVFNIITNVDNKYTGDQLFVAVNEHRQSIGVQPLELDGALCDNLVERWLAIREPNAGHKGFEAWAEGEGLTKDGVAVAPYATASGITELFIQNATTTDWALQGWIGSPGHKVILEKPELNVGCAYAHDGDGIVIMAEKH